MDKKSFWFYLEPYTLLFLMGRNILIYNELNHKYLEYLDINSENLLHLVKLLIDDKNNYCIQIDENILQENDVINFINIVRSSFSGDLVERTSEIKPLITKPQIILNNSREYLKLDSNYSIGYKSKLLLREITISTGAYTSKIKCNNIFFSNNPNSNDFLIYHYLDKISFELQSFPHMEVVNLICYPNSNYEQIIRFNEKNKNIFKTINHIEIETFIKYHSIFEDDINLKIYIKPPISTQLRDYLKIIEKNNISFCCFVSNEQELSEASELQKTLNLNLDFYPLLSSNLEFFEKNVFFNKEDIQHQKLSVKEILSKKLFNSNFFGRIVLDENGSITPYFNYTSNLNISNYCLIDSIIQELEQGKFWFLTRNSVNPCKNCIYCLFCPPISEFEIELGKYDLCNI